ncbi:hypothetical protein C8R43DRAFT_993312 [Mycena crocata]|nr:hypothetical protein C8R43DRAFT_993312 [Mycena crocata]
MRRTPARHNTPRSPTCIFLRTLWAPPSALAHAFTPRTHSGRTRAGIILKWSSGCQWHLHHARIRMNSLHKCDGGEKDAPFTPEADADTPLSSLSAAA